MALQPKSALARARACIRIEGAALAETARGLGAEFVATARAVEAVNAAGGKLIFSGVGKSAHIAQKIAATFNSTGIASCFLDATQALHGDLGLCSEGNLAFLLSNSGQTEEILRLLPVLKRIGLQVVAFTGHADSDLAQGADHRLLYRVKREACPLELAPTASTTAALALGDALAMVLLESRGLTRDDFAKYHPAGNLGRVLLLRVRDIMRTGQRLPVARDTVTTQEAILAMTKAKSGSIALVAPKSGRLTGILTDGDFRRSALTGPDFLRQPVAAFMTRTPKTIREDALGVDALQAFPGPQDRRPDRGRFPGTPGRADRRTGSSEAENRVKPRSESASSGWEGLQVSTTKRCRNWRSRGTRDLSRPAIRIRRRSRRTANVAPCRARRGGWHRLPGDARAAPPGAGPGRCAHPDQPAR
jgi:arabinose-5-phosphate isomerase